MNRHEFGWSILIGTTLFGIYSVAMSIVRIVEGGDGTSYAIAACGFALIHWAVRTSG